MPLVCPCGIVFDARDGDHHLRCPAARAFLVRQVTRQFTTDELADEVARRRMKK